MNSEEPANYSRVVAWARSKPRKPANLAFTAGAERQAAYWIEWAEAEYLNKEKTMAEDSAKDKLKCLTPRELSILSLIAHGNTAKTIAELLCISVRTVEVHKTNLYQKLGVNGKTEAAVIAVAAGLLE